MTKNNAIELTPDFRLTTDGDRNFILERRHTVDPTKAPDWDRRNTKAIATTGEGLSVEKREDWREIGYYGFTAQGLAAVLSAVAVRSAWHESAHLWEYVEKITEERRRLTELTEGLREVVA